MNWTIFFEKLQFGFITGAVASMSTAVIGLTISGNSNVLTDLKNWGVILFMSAILGGLNGGLTALNNYYKHKDENNNG